MAFGYFKTFTVDHTQCGTADSTDFPITIWITDADLKTVGNGGYVQNASGYDIRPYADGLLTVPLTFELVYYDGVNGILEMHVKVSTLNHVSDVIYYLAFGDASISSDGSSTATWESNFKGVWHLTTIAGAMDTTDATSNGKDGTATNGNVEVAGQIDGAGAMAITGPGNDQYIEGNSAISASALTNFTVSAWVNPQAGGGLNTAIFADRFSSSAVNYALCTQAASTTDYYIGFYNGSWRLSGPVTLNGIGTWVFLSGTYDGSDLKLYKNNAAPSSAAETSTPTTDALGWRIGRRWDAADYFQGYVDEVRISSVARSASWITAEYNNQKSSSTFLTWGARTPVPSGAVSWLGQTIVSGAGADAMIPSGTIAGHAA